MPESKNRRNRRVDPARRMKRPDPEREKSLAQENTAVMPWFGNPKIITTIGIIVIFSFIAVPVVSFFASGGSGVQQFPQPTPNTEFLAAPTWTPSPTRTPSPTPEPEAATATAQAIAATATALATPAPTATPGASPTPTATTLPTPLPGPTPLFR
jgi:hypothetical protein